MAEQRIIEQRPPSNEELRWRGRVDPDPKNRTWHGDTPERVEQYMDATLGPLNKGEKYLVIEGGA
jgi:hypothetical protein